MFGRNGKFFKILDSLLSLSEKAVILVAGSGDIKTFGKNVRSLTNRDRIYYIGNRKDINEVFRHCDIYLDTYPLGGGLMEQYACVNAKPLLIYSDFSMPVIDRSQAGETLRVYNKTEDLLHYAKRLILDNDYRRDEGSRNIQFVCKEDTFNSRLERILANAEETSPSWNEVKIDYVQWRNLYLEVENDFMHYGIKLLLANSKLTTFRLLPQYTLILFNSCLSFAINKIKRFLKIGGR